MVSSPQNLCEDVHAKLITSVIDLITKREFLITEHARSDGAHTKRRKTKHRKTKRRISKRRQLQNVESQIVDYAKMHHKL
jgi:hypothetical protein